MRVSCVCKVWKREGLFELFIVADTSTMFSCRSSLFPVKSELKEKDQTATRLKTELQDAKEDLINYKENIEAEKEKIDAEKETESEARALQRIADQDYFDADDVLSAAGSTSERTLPTAGGGSTKGRIIQQKCDRHREHGQGCRLGGQGTGEGCTDCPVGEIVGGQCPFHFQPQE